jgi:hypothetical protein
MLRDKFIRVRVNEEELAKLKAMAEKEYISILDVVRLRQSPNPSPNNFTKIVD